MYLCLPFKFWPSCPSERGILLWDIIREKSGSRVNLPLRGGGGVVLLWGEISGGIWSGGSESTTPVLDMYFYHIQAPAHFFFVHIFFSKCVNIEHFNPFWNISKCVKLVPNLTHFENFFSKWVKLVPNLTHFEKFFQSAYFFQSGLLHCSVLYLENVKRMTSIFQTLQSTWPSEPR